MKLNVPSRIGLVACAAALLGAQLPSGPPKPPKYLAAPTLARGVGSEFEAVAYRIEGRLEAGDFAGAKALLPLLPKHVVTVRWDDSKVPARERFALGAARDRAFRAWSVGVQLEFKLLRPSDRAVPDVRFSFEPVLNRPDGAPMPLGVATFFSEKPTEPRLDAVIGLQRGAPLRATTDVEVLNEAVFALGTYLGVAPSPIPTSLMNRQDGPMAVANSGFPSDKNTAESNLDMADGFANVVAKRQMVRAGRPKLFIDPVRLVPDRFHYQGDPFAFSIQVTNEGDAPLKAIVIPDCSCFSAAGEVTVPAGGSTLYPVQMDTSEYGGRVNKELYLVSNDGARGAVTIPVSVDVRRRYQFYSPKGDTILVGPDGAEYPVYLLVDGPPIEVQDARLDGIDAVVTYDRWSGTLPGFSGALHGYKFLVDVRGKVPTGRIFASLVVGTADSRFRSITAPLFAQSGIVALPDKLFMGHLAPIRRSFRVLLTRPRKPFHVLSATCDDPHFKVSDAPKPGLWEHELKVVYDGRAPIGEAAATITVRTDDKKQRTIRIALEASID